MALLIIGCVLFFGVHSLQIVWPGIRPAAIARFGEVPWKLAYTLIAIAGLIAIIVGYGQARMASTPLYAPVGVGRHIAMLLMLPVFPLLVAAYMPGRIQRAMHHPMLWATVLWAGAHLLVNGTVADVVLFGCFGVWALADLLSFTWRVARPIQQAPAWRGNDVVAVVAGLVIYAAFVLTLHGWLIGVPLFAR
ncbi:NnrU family protein [Pusillimonas sp. TS35]|uniref:NnrU family protein n=1 Tax=Paracandidimonas lactea TaxID=2895524 RepID=UPI00136B6160|nr:NnrU family protein [Pusillimonas sp. TS35]